MSQIAQRAERRLQNVLSNLEPLVLDLEAEEPDPSPLTVIVRKHSPNADPEVKIYTFVNTQPEALCHLILGGRPQFERCRRPQNKALTLLTLNHRIQLAIPGAQFMHPEPASLKHLGFLMQLFGLYVSKWKAILPVFRKVPAPQAELQPQRAIASQPTIAA
jgi:hypothetical protein